MEFQSADNGGAPGHPAPDPMLLAVRAAINWSWRNHQKVLDSGEPEPPVHPLEAQAMEEYLAWRDEQQQVRPHTVQDVAVGLHQPDGYQGGGDGDGDNEAGADDDDEADDHDLYEAVP